MRPYAERGRAHQRRQRERERAHALDQPARMLLGERYSALRVPEHPGAAERRSGHRLVLDQGHTGLPGERLGHDLLDHLRVDDLGHGLQLRPVEHQRLRLLRAGARYLDPPPIHLHHQRVARRGHGGHPAGRPGLQRGQRHHLLRQRHHDQFAHRCGDPHQRQALAGWCLRPDGRPHARRPAPCRAAALHRALHRAWPAQRGGPPRRGRLFRRAEHHGR